MADGSEVIPVNERVARIIAFYLPQFHEIPENNLWWGTGFTEWTNVRKARPLFPGHQQPRVPSPSIGYYDLGDPGIRQLQAKMAENSGIEGFCYWHYWFGNGERLLEMPVNEIVRTGEPRLPFCLCWANESWSGVWHGAPRRVLKEQCYPGPEDCLHHFREILPCFKDPRYMKVDGRPIFVIYKPHLLPDSEHYMALWNERARQEGFPGIYFIAMSSTSDDKALTSYDSVMPVSPTDILYAMPWSRCRRFSRYVASKYLNWMGGRLCRMLSAPLCYPYKSIAEHTLRALQLNNELIPCIVPGWDNTPRVGRRGMVLANADPDLFRNYLQAVIQHVKSRPMEQRFVFIKAWNEWAEGNILEPATNTGMGYLDAIREVAFTGLDKTSKGNGHDARD